MIKPREVKDDEGRLSFVLEENIFLPYTEAMKYMSVGDRLSSNGQMFVVKAREWRASGEEYVHLWLWMDEL